MKNYKVWATTMLIVCIGMVQAQTKYAYEQLQGEKLNRGVVAMHTNADSVLVSWRYLPSDPSSVTFEVLRNGERVGITRANEPTMYVDYNPQTAEEARYEVRPVYHNGVVPVGLSTSDIAFYHGSWMLPANAPIGYIDLPLQQPDSIDIIANNVIISKTHYNANDATAADLDGDGQMEIVLKWDPSDSRDNSQSGLTSPTIIDAYKLDGTLMWRVNLGLNIRSGAHYTPFIVADLDGDGCAELLVRTSDGTVDGTGVVLGDSAADHRRKPDNGKYQANGNPGEQFRGPGWPNEVDRKARRGGFIYKGPEWVTCFDGRTGRAVSTIDYIPARGELKGWGDNYANRSDRFLAACAYLDGQHLSAIFCRGYYTRSVLAAYDFDGQKLSVKWVFDTNDDDKHSYAGQGNHNLRVGDVDGDGCDEITYGSMAVDHDGTPLYNTGFGHGDAMHLTAYMPLNDALQVWDCHENKRDGSDFRDACTGEVLFQILSSKDVGRCMAADITPSSPGLEMWSSASGGICNTRGEVIDSTARIPINFGIWWDGDLCRELLDHEAVTKYKTPGTNPKWENASSQNETASGYKGDSQEGKAGKQHYDFSGSSSVTNLLKLDGVVFNNGTKSNPALCADIIGDWREEIIARTPDNQHLRIYISAQPTPYRFHTFLADPVYRHSVVMQNVGYNQPTNVGFYFGAELEGSGRAFRGWNFQSR